MLPMQGIWLLVYLFNLYGQAQSAGYQAIFHRKSGLYLGNYVIQKSKTECEIDCCSKCSIEPECVSANFKVKGKDRGLCELNSQRLDEPEEGQSDPEYDYLEVVTRTCDENEEFFKESKKCKAKVKDAFHSCKDVLTKDTSSTNGIYSLKSNTSDDYYDAYCHMTDITTCGGGGWTLVMKLDGNKTTFTYDSPLWTNNETYAMQDGLEGLTEKESKLASYWNTPFTNVCLGMTYNGDRKWMSFNFTASSLYSVIADGQFRATTAGPDAWKSLIVNSNLQPYCNKEGFNVPFNNNSIMRIGIVANNQNNCDSCDTWLGISTVYTDTRGNRMVCGNNEGSCCITYPDDGNNDWNTFGYILVQ